MVNVQIKKGFSIIELMIVILILSLMMVLTLPDFSRWILSSRMKNIGESIAFGIVEARTLAIKTGWGSYFYLNNDGSWFVSKTPPLNSQTTDATFNILERGNLKLTNKMKLSISPSNSNTIMFDDLGIMENDFKNKPSKSTVFLLSNTGNQYDESDFGIGPIKEITIGLIEEDPAINDIKVKIGVGGAVVTCVDFKVDNNLPNNCKNIQM